jgi:predicted nucleotidyltransferase
MTKTYTEILKEIWEQKRKYFENYRKYCEEIKKISLEILGEARLIIFGSIIKGNWGPKSDIDVLVISDRLPVDWEARRLVREKIKLNLPMFAPFQIHLATTKEYENWYEKFIKDDYKEI